MNYDMATIALLWLYTVELKESIISYQGNTRIMNDKYTPT